MSQLQRRSGNRMTRSQRERRAFRLTLATGAAGLATVVVLVLAIPGITSFSLAFVLAVLTGALAFVLKRTVGR